MSGDVRGARRKQVAVRTRQFPLSASRHRVDHALGLTYIDRRIIRCCTVRHPVNTQQTLRWLAKLKHLKPAPDRQGIGVAPHKALLLLAVIDMIEAGEQKNDLLWLSPSLVFRFQSFWKIVVDRRRNRGDIRMPFHALGTQRIWTTLTDDLRPSTNRANTAVVRFDPELLSLLQSPEFRQQARVTLIEGYFPADEQVSLYAMVKVDADRIRPTLAKLKEQVAEYSARRAKGRDQRFAIEVVTKYDFACALTGYRLTTARGANIVEAAHIHGWSDSKNDDPRNGLALTPDAHWMFDEGLWSVTDDFRVLVAEKAFEEWSPAGTRLRALHGRSLFFMPHTTLRPDSRCITWHRANRFQG